MLEVVVSSLRRRHVILSSWSVEPGTFPRTPRRTLLVPFNLPFRLNLRSPARYLKFIEIDLALFADVLQYLLLAIWVGDRKPALATCAANEDCGGS